MRMFWKLYRNTPKKERKEFLRRRFWAYMYDHHPKIFWWCEKHLTCCDILPF